MSRKHYEALAEVVNKVSDGGGAFAPTEILISAMCSVFTQDNPSFDRDKFIAACTKPLTSTA